MNMLVDSVICNERQSWPGVVVGGSNNDNKNKNPDSKVPRKVGQGAVLSA